MISSGLVQIQGFVRIFDPNSGEIFVDKKNAIHYENMSISLAETLSHRTSAQDIRNGIWQWWIQC